MTDPKRCKATNRQGEQCGRPPMRGGRVCASHGGKVPNVLAASQQRLAVQEVTREVARLSDARGPLTLPDVYRELLDIAGTAVAWHSVLRDRVEALEDYSTTSLVHGEQARTDVLLFERGMDRAAKTLELVARLDLDARLVRISEMQGQQVAGALQAALNAGDLTREQRDAVQAALAAELRKLGAL